MSEATTPAPTQGRVKLPKWAVEELDLALDHIERLHQVLHLSMQGISMVRSVPNAIRILAEVDGKLEEEETTSQLKRAHAAAELAHREVEGGFPLLHAQASISLWAALEATIKTFLAKWLFQQPEAIQAKQLQNLKVHLGQYESLDRQDRCDYTVELLERDLEAPLKHGVDRFESLLQVIELSGPVEEEHKKTLFELQQVRNVLMHRRGIADKKLATACPWLKIEVGKPITLDHQAYGRYAKAVDGYLAILIRRATKFFTGNGIRNKQEEATKTT
jgi:hypothetical protein